MQNEKDQTHDQKDVDESRAYVKCQKPKQPENNQNHRDYSKHVFVSLSLGEEIREFHAPHSADGHRWKLRLIQTYVDHYNTLRLHSAIGYVTPQDMLAGRQAEIHAARDRKLEAARHQRQLRRAAVSMLAHFSNTTTMTSPGETEAGSAGMQPC